MVIDFLSDLVNLENESREKQSRDLQFTRTDIHQILKIIKRINITKHPDQLVPELLQQALTLVNAEQAWLVEIQNDIPVVTQGVDQNGDALPADNSQISRSIVNQVLKSGEPLKIENLSEDRDMGTIQSIQNLELKSVLCAPLANRDKLQRVLYVETRKRQTYFSYKNLIMLDAMAEIIGNLLNLSSQAHELQQAHAKISELNRFYLSIMDAMPNGMIIFDQHGGVELMNQTMKRWEFNSRKGEFRKLFDKCTALNPDETHSYPVEYSLNDKTWNLYPFPVPDQKRGVIIADNTRLKETENQLISAEKRALVSQLAAGIAHEIKNALSPAMGRIQLMHRLLEKAGVSDMDAMEHQLDTIDTQLQRIEKISGNLNNLSRPQVLHVSEFSFSRMMEHSIELLTDTAGILKHFVRDQNLQTGYTLQVYYNPQQSYTVSGDEDQLQQMVINLMINAIHAVEDRGSGFVKLTIDLSGKEMIEFRVIDSGIGIPTEDIDRIWEPYFTTKERERGTGLGMMIVRSIVESHGGSIEIQSEQMVGTTVTVRLPTHTES